MHIAETDSYNLDEATIIFTFLVPSCQKVVSKLLKSTIFINKRQDNNIDVEHNDNHNCVRIIAYKFPLPKEAFSQYQVFF